MQRTTGKSGLRIIAGDYRSTQHTPDSAGKSACRPETDYHIDHRQSLLIRAGESVNRALDLDPLSAEAHASLGLFQYAKHDVPSSILALTRAVELMPNYADAQSWLAWVQQLLGNSAAGLQSAKRGVAVNPLSGEATSNLTLSLLAVPELHTFGQKQINFGYFF